MRAAAFVVGTILVVSVFLVIAAAMNFGMAVIGTGSLAIMGVGAVAFVASEPRATSTDMTEASWES